MRRLDLGNPVDWAHPLNRTLVAWWAGLSPGDGATRLYDLTGRYPATLVSSPAWTPVGGGRLGLRFSGGSSADASPPLAWSGGVCVAAWVRPTTTARSDYVGRWVSSAYSFLLTSGVSAGKWSYYAVGSAGSFASAAGATTLTAGQTYRVLGYYDNATIKIFVDGREDGSTASAAGTPTHTSQFRIGKSSDNNGAALIWDVCLWNGPPVASPASFALWDYDTASRADNPRLRYSTQRAYFLPVAPPGNRRRRVIVAGAN